MGADDGISAQSDQACEQEEEPVLGWLNSEERSQPGAENGCHCVHPIDPGDDAVQGSRAARCDFIHGRLSYNGCT